MYMDAELEARLDLGVRKYGHGVRVDDDTTSWGTKENSWFEMAREEFLDAIVYVIADYIRCGRLSQEGKSRMEELHGDTCESDDNKLILFIHRNYDDMEQCKHKVILWNLYNLLRMIE